VHLGCFDSFPILNAAAISMGVQMFALYPDLYSFGYITGSGIAGSYGSSIFSFFGNLHNALHNSFTHILRVFKDYCFPTALPAFVVLSTIAILIEVR
jgi:hypothetical protein